MPSTLEEEIGDYYKFKGHYTELLHQCASAHIEQGQTKSGKVVKTRPQQERFLSQGAPEYAAKARSKIDLAAIVAMSKTLDEEPKKEKPKGGSKGKK